MSFRDASMTAILDALSQTADKLFSNLGEPTDHALFQYSAALGGGSEEQVALQKSLRLLHMFVRFGDALGQVQACEALAELVRRGGAASRMACLLYTSPSPRDGLLSRMPSSA